MATMERLLLCWSTLAAALWAIWQGSSASVKDRPPTIFVFRTMGMVWITIMVLIVESTIRLMVRFFWLPAFSPYSLDLLFCTNFVWERIRTWMPRDSIDCWLWARGFLCPYRLLIYKVENSFMIVVIIWVMIVSMCYTMLVCSLMLIVKSFFSSDRWNFIECPTPIRLWNFGILLDQWIFWVGVTSNQVFFIKRIIVVWCCCHACSSNHH